MKLLRDYGENIRCIFMIKIITSIADDFFKVLLITAIQYKYLGIYQKLIVS